jgi:hypothetical protein
MGNLAGARRRRIVAPLPEAVTVLTPHAGIIRLPWGASTDLFDPARVEPVSARPCGAVSASQPEATVAILPAASGAGTGSSRSSTPPDRCCWNRLTCMLLIGRGERWEWARTLAQNGAVRRPSR